MKAMKFPPRIRLPEMKFPGTNFLLLLALLAMIAALCGCASTDPDNASVRPWNTPQGWESPLGGMQDLQH
jgi:hypothetical protein